jgi:hypothetical protein
MSFGMTGFCCIGGKEAPAIHYSFYQKINFQVNRRCFLPFFSLKFIVIPIPIEKRIPSLGIGRHIYRKRDLSGLNKFSKVLFPIKMCIKGSYEVERGSWGSSFMSNAKSDDSTQQTISLSETPQKIATMLFL